MPPDYRAIALWPTPLQKYVQLQGADVVWQKGLRVLGYPPTWVLGLAETLRIINALDNL